MAEKLKILVVEDDQARRDDFRRKFEPERKISLATNALAAIRAIRTKQFDAIFLDGDLEEEKGMTGLDVACCLYRSGNEKSRVIIHSTNVPLARQMIAVLTDLNIDGVEISYIAKDFWEKANAYIT